MAAVQTRKTLLPCFVALVAGIVAGILIGYFGISRKKMESLDNLSKEKVIADGDVIQRIVDGINANNIKEHLREMSRLPHVAGTPRDEEMARDIQRMWREQGLFDDVQMRAYNVLLSFPDDNNPNQVHLVDGKGDVLFTAGTYEIIPNVTTKIVQAFNGYAPSGDVTAEVVYVNYGRVEDFDKLDELGVNVSGKICIARYGKIYRGNKVVNAYNKGAVGVVMFLDPSEVALEGTDEAHVYPNTIWMPGSAVQRGSTYVGNGDPLTPGYPSLDGAYRFKISEVAELPKIPAQPIGYDDAKRILELLGGDTQTPKDWIGGLNIPYRLGPGFFGSHRDKRVRLVVNNQYKVVPSYNVIATVKGTDEPDRYVLVGNHRDAWGFGSVDPSSGTAQMMELSRLLGQLRKDGLWTPKRTLVFCSWGAEEYGLLGSTEFVEEYIHELADRAVAYLNIDSCASGDVFHLDASPCLMNFARDMAKLVPDPKDPQKTLYETWRNVSTEGKNDEEPDIKTLGAGTDHAPFSFYAGIPAINYWWKLDKKKYNVSSYPAYHTAFETFNLMEKFIDPDFSLHRTCSRLTGVMLFHLTTDNILPYNVTTLAVRMKTALDTLNKTKDKLARLNITLDHIAEAIGNFTEATKTWHMNLKEVEKNNPMSVRRVNDRMMMLERVFIIPEGLPNRPTTRHVAFAPSEFDQYSSAGFPAITDLLHGIEDLKGEMLNKRKTQLHRHVSDIMIIVKMAATFLKDNPFM